MNDDAAFKKSNQSQRLSARTRLTFGGVKKPGPYYKKNT